MTAMAIVWEAVQTLGALAAFAALTLVLPERVRFWRSRWRREPALGPPRFRAGYVEKGGTNPNPRWQIESRHPGPAPLRQASS